MVKLKEVEDEHFAEKPSTTKDDALLESDDDDDYTDTGEPLHAPAFTCEDKECWRGCCSGQLNRPPFIHLPQQSRNPRTTIC